MPEPVALAFRMYCDLPAGKRSLANLAAKLDAEAAAGLDVPTRRARTLGEWSTRYDWVGLSALVISQRMAGRRVDLLEAAGDHAGAALDKLAELLDAQQTVVTPKGEIHTGAALDVQLKAATALLDRAGLAPAKSMSIEHSGPDGGPIPFAGVVAQVDLSGMSAGELVEHLRRQVTG